MKFKDPKRQICKCYKYSNCIDCIRNSSEYHNNYIELTTLSYINKTREYLDYIENHVINVYKAWEVLKEKCKDMRFIYDDYHYFSIDAEIKMHDLSKLSEYEFVQYRKGFYPTYTELKFDMSEAWEHHKKENPHHWESWIEKDMSSPNEWEWHCVHMIVDWMAMGYKFGDTAQKYYEKNKDKIKIPEYAEAFINEIFERIKENG